jgi:hypothetical protein
VGVFSLLPGRSVFEDKNNKELGVVTPDGSVGLARVTYPFNKPTRHPAPTTWSWSKKANPVPKRTSILGIPFALPRNTFSPQDERMKLKVAGGGRDVQVLPCVGLLLVLAYRLDAEEE